jgi:hypothetical protein
MNLVCYERKNISVTEWNSFVDICDEAWFWHRSEFIDAFSTWRGASDVSFYVFDEDTKDVLAVFQLCKFEEYQISPTTQYKIAIKNTIKKLLRYKDCKTLDLHDYACHYFSLGGYAIKNNLPQKIRKEILQCIEDCLRRIRCDSRGRIANMSVSLPPLAKAYWPDICPLYNPLLFIGFTNTPSQTWVVDLNKSRDQIFDNCSRTSKQRIKKAQAGNYTLYESHNYEDYSSYFKLHSETYMRTGVGKTHPLEYFQHTFGAVLNSGLCHILFIGKDDKFFAGNISVIYKNVGMYWQGASLDEKDPNLTKYLLYQQILYAKDRGCRYFETGEAFPHLREGKLKGISDYKKSVGCFLHPIYKGCMI